MTQYAIDLERDDSPLLLSPDPLWALVAQETQAEWLYRLTLHFQNLKRTARRFVVEHGDHQPPGIPSEGVKVRSVLF
jgi:hypothetical protein